MSGSKGIVIWTFLLIITGDVVRGQTGPNAVALINGHTTLDCVANLLAGSQWTSTTDGSSSALLIATGCSVIGNNSVHYGTEQAGGNVCRLIIINATMQQAGVYTCFDGASTLFRSLVTIINPNANVVVHNQSEVVVGDQLNISCSINYNGPASPAPSLRPSPYWTTSSNQTFTSSIYHPSTNVVTLVATVTVQKPTVPVFQCKTVFEITGNTSGYNSTPPPDNLTLFGNTTPIDVQYYPEKIGIASSVSAKDNCVYKQEYLTCTADANPPAQFQWLDLNTNNITNGSIKYITSGGRYQCAAYNSIRNQTRNETKTATETSCYPVKQSNITISGTGCTSNTCYCNGSQAVTLTCLVHSIPGPGYEWWSNVPRHGNLGNNDTIHAKYNGTYNCTANNAYGDVKNNGTVSILVANCTSESSSLARIAVPVYVGVSLVLGFVCFPIH